MNRRRTAVAALVAVTTALSTASASAATPASWSIDVAAIGQPLRTSTSQPSPVSCTSSTHCVQIANSKMPTIGGYAITTDASTTTIARLPIPVDASDDAVASLQAVTCLSDSSCVAVGQYHTFDGRDRGLIETLKSGRWHASAAPDPGGPEAFGAGLTGVACNADQCVATGSYDADALRINAFIVVRDGAAPWRLEPIDSSFQQDFAFGAACPTHGACIAVFDGGFGNELLTQQDGVWEITAFPFPTTPDQFSVYTLGFSCPTDTCFGVFTYTDAGTGRPKILALSYVGGQASSELIRPGAVDLPAALNGARISCHAGSSVVCAGMLGATADRREIVLVYRHGAWKLRRTPALPADRAGPYLTAVSCAAGPRCAMVGSDTVHGVQRPLVYDWDGTAWTPVLLGRPAGVPPTDDVTLDGVSCAGTTCVASGTAKTGPYTYRLLTARYG